MLKQFKLLISLLKGNDRIIQTGGPVSGKTDRTFISDKSLELAFQALS